MYHFNECTDLFVLKNKKREAIDLKKKVEILCSSIIDKIFSLLPNLIKYKLCFYKYFIFGNILNNFCIMSPCKCNKFYQEGLTGIATTGFGFDTYPLCPA